MPNGLSVVGFGDADDFFDGRASGEDSLPAAHAEGFHPEPDRGLLNFQSGRSLIGKPTNLIVDSEQFVDTNSAPIANIATGSASDGAVDWLAP